jgi:hypothetical protein
MLTIGFLLQFLVPLGLILWVIWRFVLTPATHRTMHRMEEEAQAERVKARIVEEFAKEDALRTMPATDDELDQAIRELKDKP